MGDLICFILVCIVLYLYTYESHLRKELKMKPYWNQLPKGTSLFGHLLPIIWVLICNDTTFFALRIIICIVITCFFICCVASLDSTLKKDYPDEDRVKIVKYNLLTPLLMISYLIIIGFVIEILSYKKKR